jgi:cation diffusion facilitator CzcD-associated flavoprotein CzcO
MDEGEYFVDTNYRSLITSLYYPAVIGSGASAIQIVPEIAKDVKELYVFQRTAPYVFYKTDFEFPSFVKSIFRCFPFLLRLARWGIFIATEARFPGLYANSLFNWWMKADSLRYMRSIVKDKDLQKKITPNYAIGCKRMLFSSLWYPALTKSNVHIVTNPLIGVNNRGIEVKNEEGNAVPGTYVAGGLKGSNSSSSNSRTSGSSIIDLDIIVYATGFQLTRENAPEKYAFEVIGKDGVSLNHWMQTAPKTLLGISAPNFPNLFHIYGPNSSLGHNSIVFMIECQVNYMMRLIQEAERKKFKTILVKEEDVEKFQSECISPGLRGKVGGGAMFILCFFYLLSSSSP